MSVLIKGGRVITAADDYVGDVYVEGERVSLIGESLDVEADKVIDAGGKYVLPGCIDPHTHLDMPFGGTTTIDDVESGQIAAAFGGTTCHVDFIIQPKGASFAEAFDEWRGKANGKQVIDMGYHMAVTDLREGGSLEELATLPDQGITSYKLFMAYKGALMVDDETLFRTMQVAAETGALVMVHAENGDAIDVLCKQAKAEGKIEPHYHALTRPPETEGEATNRAIQLARVAGCALYVVHVSCLEAVEPIALAREKGWEVHGETCTQYFFIDYTFLERPNFEGAKYVYTPPPRDKANQEVLWAAVRNDVLSAISTDHCAFLWEGQKTLGRTDCYLIPNGAPAGMGTVIDEDGLSLHVFGTDDGHEYLRFDCFDDAPHYHYIDPPTSRNVVHDYDAVANGPIVEWAFEALRTRLREMLTHAGASALASAVDMSSVAALMPEVEAEARRMLAIGHPVAVG